MSAVLEVVFVAASLVASLAAPPSAGSAEKGARVVVIEASGSPEAAVAAYVRERAAVTWAGGADAPRSLEVRVAALADGLGVTVLEGGESWAQRDFALAGADATALRLAVWLFVRSTVTRALAEAPLARARDVSPGLAGSGAGEGVAGAASAGARSGGELPSVSAAEGPVGEEAAVAPGEEAAVAPGEADARDEGANGGRPRPWLTRSALLVTTAMGTDRAWALGVALTAGLTRPGPATAWAELGYAVSPGTSGLLVHRLPAGLAAGVRPPWLESLELAFGAWAEAKLASSSGRRDWALGLGAGPAARWSGALLGREAVVRLAWIWGVRRQRWETDAGAREEAPSTVALALGVGLP